MTGYPDPALYSAKGLVGDELGANSSARRSRHRITSWQRQPNRIASRIMDDSDKACPSWRVLLPE